MAEQRNANYEGMFLLTQNASADLGAAVDHINTILKKGSASLIAMSKWDERRFAYEIKKQRRGTYILTYFNCDTQSIEVMERECNLSESILRVLFIRCDHLSDEEMRSTDAQQALADAATLQDDGGDSPAAETTSEVGEPEAAPAEA
ncbi:MAG: 30S ribosomal protein S6 [Planctomycetota bacterium]|jgi:small subunit ribosomal protein S6